MSYSKVSEIAIGDVKLAYDYVVKEFKHYKSLKVGNIENNDLDTKIRVAIIASFKKDDEKQKIKNDLFEDVENQEQEQPLETKKEESSDVFGRPAYEIHKPRKL
jgi:cell division GTPase FtsZ